MMMNRGSLPLHPAEAEVYMIFHGLFIGAIVARQRHARQFVIVNGEAAAGILGSKAKQGRRIRGKGLSNMLVNATGDGVPDRDHLKTGTTIIIFGFGNKLVQQILIGPAVGVRIPIA